MNNKDILDLHNKTISDHYALWNYLWIGAAAMIGLTGMIVKDHKPAICVAVPLLVLAFIGFAAVNVVLLFQSQVAKLNYSAQLLALGMVVAKPWPSWLIFVGHFLLDGVVIAVAVTLAVFGRPT
jgi:hypothetical protein